MHGYGMNGWDMGWMWIPGVVSIIALALIFRLRSPNTAIVRKASALLNGGAAVQPSEKQRRTQVMTTTTVKDPSAVWKSD
jgi:aspartate/methionine/tyrosine aminotransferase